MITKVQLLILSLNIPKAYEVAQYVAMVINVLVTESCAEFPKLATHLTDVVSKVMDGQLKTCREHLME
jgi:cobalamin biosynthesis protein CobD/CbiB